MAYVVPTSSDLKARYPAFAAVDDGTITYWITDAQRFVDESWSEGDYGPAMLSLAAHNMTLSGLGADAAAALAAIPAGVSRFKSGTLEVALTDAAANARMTGDFTASKYGQEYQLLLRRNRGGPVVADTGCVPTYPFGYPPFAQGWY